MMLILIEGYPTTKDSAKQMGIVCTFTYVYVWYKMHHKVCQVEQATLFGDVTD